MIPESRNPASNVDGWVRVRPLTKEELKRLLNLGVDLDPRNIVSDEQVARFIVNLKDA